MDGTIIVADDDRSIRTVLSQALTRAGCRVRATSTISTLWQWIEEGEGDLVISDVMMPDGDALDLVPAIKRNRPELPVIIMSAQNTVMTAIRAADAGAFDYFPKPFDLRDMLSKVNKGLSAKKLPPPADIANDHDATGTSAAKLPLVGGSPAMQDVYRILARLTNTDLSVLITGESGTGKELVARTLHDFGQRAASPFVVAALGSIPSDSIDTELFGRDGGQAGCIERAQGGTLFLDEVGDIPLETQGKILRVLQKGAFSRVDGQNEIETDIRLIAATNKNISNLVTEGRVREDLYYRLNVVPIHLPPLRDRIGDIPELVRHFLALAGGEAGHQPTISGDAMTRLSNASWFGNVRELRNFVQRLVVLSTSDTIDRTMVEAEFQRGAVEMPDDANDGTKNLSQSVQSHLEHYFALHSDALPPSGLYHRILRDVEHPLISIVLAETHGNQLQAAELLGINRNTLRKKIRELDIPVMRGKRMM
jgi:two-component system nitrogen regulation response regulator GlnG